MNAYLIRKPIITEKSLTLANRDNTFTFLVDRTATKEQIRSAIEVLFKVNVIKICTVLNAPEIKRTGKKRVTTKSAKEKKAMVTLKSGQTIDLFDVGGQN